MIIEFFDVSSPDWLVGVLACETAREQASDTSRGTLLNAEVEGCGRGPESSVAVDPVVK